MADEELRQAFRETATKLGETKQRIAHGEVVKQTAVKNERSSRLAAATLQELGDKPTFKAVGRAFVLSTHAEELKRHTEEAEAQRLKIVNLEENRSKLEKSMEETERNLREMVEQRRTSD